MDQKLSRLVKAGAFSGVLSISSYLLIAFLDLPIALVFFLAMLFPLLGIVFIYALSQYIKSLHSSHANNLAQIFGIIGFAILAAFLSAQIAVNELSAQQAPSFTPAMLQDLKSAIRLVDMGMDVAWDVFIGAYLILFLVSTWTIASLKYWGVVLGLLGLGLILLNVYTFPQPPGESGLVDLGPFIALGLMTLAIRSFFLAKK